MMKDTMFFLELVLDYAVINISVIAPAPSDEEETEDVVDRLIPLACTRFRNYYGFDLEKFVIDASYEYEEL
jgi:hypothetical protein